MFTVKARARHGTNSLDLTIPVKLVKDLDIKEGDVFSVVAFKNDDGIDVLEYRRVFKIEKT